MRPLLELYPVLTARDKQFRQEITSLPYKSQCELLIRVSEDTGENFPIGVFSPV
jgi:hypothetical protein